MCVCVSLKMADNGQRTACIQSVVLTKVKASNMGSPPPTKMIYPKSWKCDHILPLFGLLLLHQVALRKCCPQCHRLWTHSRLRGPGKRSGALCQTIFLGIEDSRLRC